MYSYGSTVAVFVLVAAASAGVDFQAEFISVREFPVKVKHGEDCKQVCKTGESNIARVFLMSENRYRTDEQRLVGNLDIELHHIWSVYTVARDKNSMSEAETILMSHLVGEDLDKYNSARHMPNESDICASNKRLGPMLVGASELPFILSLTVTSRPQRKKCFSKSFGIVG